MQKNSLKIGHAGEHFTCFVSLMQGYDAYKVSGQKKFDVLIEYNNILYKVQVKTSQYRDRSKKNPSLTFQLRRRAMDYTTKKSVDHKYRKRDIDLYAFVSPEYLKIAFIPVKDIVNTYKLNLREEDFKKHTLDKALERLDGI